MSDETTIEERSGIASVNESIQKQSTGMKGMILIFAVVIGAILIWVSWDKGEGKPEEEAARPGAIRVAQPFIAAPEPAKVQPTVISPPHKPTPLAPPPTQKEIKITNQLLESSRRAPVIAFTGSGQPKGNSQASNETGQNGSLLLGPGQRPDPNSLGEMLKSVKLEGTRARQIANMHMTVPKGTHIPCTLETAMSSDQPGLVSCIIARDVMSASGQVVLMEKGSKAFGEYQGGIKSGQKRLFVLWSEVRTPHGVVVTLDSPATDQLGRAGVTGKIDTKFWERFGGALLMSVVSDASAFAFQQLGEQIGVEFKSTEKAPNEAIAIAVEQSINIPPTLYKNPGEAVNIFVARDLDFSDVYSLRRTETLQEIYDRTIDTDVYELPMIVK